VKNGIYLLGDFESAVVSVHTMANSNLCLFIFIYMVIPTACSGWDKIIKYYCELIFYLQIISLMLINGIFYKVLSVLWYAILVFVSFILHVISSRTWKEKELEIWWSHFLMAMERKTGGNLLKSPTKVT